MDNLQILLILKSIERTKHSFMPFEEYGKENVYVLYRQVGGHAKKITQ